MARKNLTRRRPRPDEGDATLGDALSKAGRRAAKDAVKSDTIVERTGPVQSVRRREQGQFEGKEPVPTREKVEVDLSDLEALSKMDADDLAALYDAQPLHKRLSEGDRVTATVIRVSGQDVLLDVGGKSEASMDPAEIPDLRPGESVDAWVVWTDGEQVRLSTKLQGHIASSFLEEAAAAGVPVQGTVTARTNGGFTVAVGDQTAFVPQSHIERLRGVDLDSFVGRELSFLVLEAGERVVLSRRRLQEAELADRTASLWDSLQVGEVVDGVVTRAMDFGVFVDVDGVEGLLPRSAITSDQQADLSQDFPGGRQVRVRVTRIDREARRVSFALDGHRPQRTRKDGPADKPAASAGEGGFGTLGDLLGSWKG